MDKEKLLKEALEHLGIHTQKDLRENNGKYFRYGSRCGNTGKDGMIWSTQ